MALRRIHHTRVPVAALSAGERRQLTVFFCDLVDSTQLSQIQNGLSVPAWPLDAEGRKEDQGLEPFAREVAFLPLRVLRRHVREGTADVVAIAGGPDKVDAIRIALRASW